MLKMELSDDKFPLTILLLLFELREDFVLHTLKYAGGDLLDSHVINGDMSHFVQLHGLLCRYRALRVGIVSIVDKSCSLIPLILLEERSSVSKEVKFLNHLLETFVMTFWDISKDRRFVIPKNVSSGRESFKAVH